MRQMVKINIYLFNITIICNDVMQTTKLRIEHGGFLQNCIFGIHNKTSIYMSSLKHPDNVSIYNRNLQFEVQCNCHLPVKIVDGTLANFLGFSHFIIVTVGTSTIEDSIFRQEKSKYYKGLYNIHQLILYHYFFH